MVYKMDVALNVLHKPVFFEEVPALYNIAICKFIQQSWHEELVLQKHEGKLYSCILEFEFLQVTINLKCRQVKLFWNAAWEETQLSRYIFKKTESLSEQSKIQRCLEYYAMILLRDFQNWMRFHRFILFWGSSFWDSESIPFPLVDLLCNFEFVYDVYGGIDYEKTAQNLLICDKVTPYHKFIIACVYCFETEIERLWFSVQTERGHNQSKMEDHAIVQFWINRLTNQANTALLQYNPSGMFKRSMTNSAMKYFWRDIKTFDEQVNCIGGCFKRYNSLAMKQCMIYWFPKMNEKFLKCVLSRYGTCIMIKLIQASSCRKFMLSFWQHTADMFEGEQFLKILERMNAVRYQDFCLIGRVLWCNAPPKPRIHVLNHYLMEDSLDSVNCVMERIYARNPFSTNMEGSLLLESDYIYYPDGCECDNDPDGEDCKCKTLIW